jgi:ATP-dependent Zn protease
MDETPEAEKDTRTIEAIAYHEAGHAVLTWQWKLAPAWVAIKPLPDGCDEAIRFAFNSEDLGLFRLAGEFDPEQAKRTWFARVLLSYAGMNAEAKYMGPEGAPLPLDDQIQVHRNLAMSGQDDPNLIDLACRKLTGLFVKEHWAEIQAIAAALVERRCLDAGEIQGILEEIQRRSMRERMGKSQPGA